MFSFPGNASHHNFQHHAQHIRYLRARTSSRAFGGRCPRISPLVAFPDPRSRSICTVCCTIVCLSIAPQRKKGAARKVRTGQTARQRKKGAARKASTGLSTARQRKKGAARKREEVYQQLISERVELREKAARIYETQSKEREEMIKWYKEEREEMSKKREEMFASQVVTLKVWPPSACVFSASLSIRLIY